MLLADACKAPDERLSVIRLFVAVHASIKASTAYKQLMRVQKLLAPGVFAILTPSWLANAGGEFIELHSGHVQSALGSG